MRELTEVISQMLLEIPADGKGLSGALENCYSSAIVSSPEQMQFWWRETAMELEDFFCEMDGEVKPPQLETGSWQERVFNIWMKLE